MKIAKLHEPGLRIQELRQGRDHVGCEFAVGEARFDQVGKSIVLVQGVSVCFECGNEEIAKTTIRAECSGVDALHGFQEGWHVDGAFDLRMKHTLGQLFQERNVVFVGHAVHACVEV